MPAKKLSLSSPKLAFFAPHHLTKDVFLVKPKGEIDGEENVFRLIGTKEILIWVLVSEREKKIGQSMQNEKKHR